MIKLLSIFAALFLIVSGLFLMCFPTAAGLLYDIDNLQEFDSPMALGMGTRQLSLGLIIFFLAIFKQLKALGIVMLVGAIVPLIDFFIFSPVTGTTSALRHLIAVPLLFGIGLTLLIQENKDK